MEGDAVIDTLCDLHLLITLIGDPNLENAITDYVEEAYIIAADPRYQYPV